MTTRLGARLWAWFALPLPASLAGQEPSDGSYFHRALDYGSAATLAHAARCPRDRIQAAPFDIPQPEPPQMRTIPGRALLPARHAPARQRPRHRRARGRRLEDLPENGEPYTVTWETGNAYWLDADPPRELHGDLFEGPGVMEVMVIEMRR